MILRILLLLLITFGSANAAKIKGIIRDQNKDPLSFASVVVKGQTLGTMANERGEFLLDVPANKTYELVFQFLGYKTVIKQVEVGTDDVFIEIQLQEQSILLGEIKVGKSKEDPAYAIMRKAIAKSKINDKQVDHYDADVYIKNTLLVNKVPGILKKKLEENHIKVGIPYVSESLTNIKFTQPNKRVTKVLAKRSSMDEMDLSGAYYLVNFYDLPDDMNLISPLSPKAFAYYKFEYLGYFEDRGRVINKIKIIPRRYGPGVCKGTIFIIEDLWSIHSIDAETVNEGFTIKMKQLYSPQQEVWVPVSQNIDFSGKVFGFDFHAKLQVHPKYKSLRINQKYVAEVKVLDKFEVPKNRAKKEINLQQEELTLKDLRKLSKQIEKTEKKESPVVTIDSTSTDSLANKRSEEYWNTIRSIPLTIEETKSYKTGDSIRIVVKREDSLKTEPKTKTTRNKHLDRLFIGSSFKLKDQWKLQYTSPLLPFFGVNYDMVQGIFTEAKVNFTKTQNKNLNYAWNNQVRYSFGLKKLMGGSEFITKYKKNTFEIGASSLTRSFDREQTMPIWANSLVNLFKINLIQMYLKEEAHVGYTYKNENRFTYSTQLEYSKRSFLDNLNKLPLAIGGRTPTPNIPRNEELDTTYFPTHNAWVWSNSITFKPGAKYKLVNGKKRYAGSEWPSFILSYNKGMGEVDYDFTSLGIDHDMASGPDERFRFYLEGGSFLNHKQVYLMDMRHVNTIKISGQEGYFRFFRMLNTRLPIQLSPENYYKYSTQGSYIKLHAVNEFRRLLLSQIPIVRYSSLKEDLFINYLKTPALKNYVELGYGIDGIFRLLRIEVLTAIEQGHKPRWGWQIGVTF